MGSGKRHKNSKYHGVKMTEQLEAIEERRSESQQLIEHMLKERNELFSLLLKVSSESSSEEPFNSKSDLEEFVQLLVDYIAAAHFGLYQRIAEGKERRKAVSELAVKIYPRIEQTTETALAFDEKYSSENDGNDLSDLKSDLSRLCEELSTRIELEDQLIDTMIGKDSS